ncbi:hypothetical protein F4809DRAFT_607380 [Biscogniauxia mediterranea]|nr:hypothetical protein F4809DRAFT_607380 [Biscogniauxia mediterranea]
MATVVAQATPTCCGKNVGGECVCGMFRSLPLTRAHPGHHSHETNFFTLHTAKQATCSCGKQSALHCTCEKAPTENTVVGARCSCRARPAGQCNCDNAAKENAAVSGSTCECGARAAGSCTCERAAGGASNPNETDFTTQK